MGKKTKVMYWIIRSVALVTIAIAAVGIIKNMNNVSERATHIGYAVTAVGILFFTFVPDYLLYKGVLVPNIVSNTYLAMITCSMLLGDVFGFYKKVHIWDSLLHFSSPALIGLFAYSLINLLNSNKTLNNLNPLFIALFVFSFIMMTGVVWEIFEYCMDTFAGYNMQRYKNNYTGEVLIGQAALYDTMKDYILNTAGALVTSIIIFFDAKRSKRIAKAATLQLDAARHNKVKNSSQSRA